MNNTMNLYVQETWIDRTQGCGAGESDVYETRYDAPGALYRAMQQEYGRCVSRVYVDGTDGAPHAIGWVFLQAARYEDTHERYLRETWVTVHQAPPTRTIKYHYASEEGAP